MNEAWATIHLLLQWFLKLLPLPPSLKLLSTNERFSMQNTGLTGSGPPSPCSRVDYLTCLFVSHCVIGLWVCQSTHLQLIDWRLNFHSSRALLVIITRGEPDGPRKWEGFVESCDVPWLINIPCNWIILDRFALNIQLLLIQFRRFGTGMKSHFYDFVIKESLFLFLFLCSFCLSPSGHNSLLSMN